MFFCHWPVGLFCFDRGSLRIVFMLHGPVYAGVVPIERESAATGVFGAVVELCCPFTSITTHTGGSN
jgi:hypothetical protein